MILNVYLYVPNDSRRPAFTLDSLVSSDMLFLFSDLLIFFGFSLPHPTQTNGTSLEMYRIGHSKNKSKRFASFKDSKKSVSSSKTWATQLIKVNFETVKR